VLDEPAQDTSQCLLLDHAAMFALSSRRQTISTLVAGGHVPERPLETHAALTLAERLGTAVLTLARARPQ
jgi:hypothetical protein